MFLAINPWCTVFIFVRSRLGIVNTTSTKRVNKYYGVLLLRFLASVWLLSPFCSSREGLNEMFIATQKQLETEMQLRKVQLRAIFRRLWKYQQCASIACSLLNNICNKVVFLNYNILCWNSHRDHQTWLLQSVFQDWTILSCWSQEPCVFSSHCLVASRIYSVAEVTSSLTAIIPNKSSVWTLSLTSKFDSTAAY